MPQPPQGVKNALKQTTGGFNSASFYSGAVAPGLTAAPGSFVTGSDVFVASGPGRLDTITLFVNTAQSGGATGINFYDAATPVSGGPIYASGHKLLASVPGALLYPPTGGVLASGQPGNVGAYQGIPFTIGAPFGSGLCFNSRSGQIAMTIAWTPEVGNQ